MRGRACGRRASYVGGLARSSDRSQHAAGKRGWFYEAWIGGDSWHRVKVAATDCPRISQAFLDEELRELGAQRFSEEYQLAWIDPDEAVFSSTIIDA